MSVSTFLDRLKSLQGADSARGYARRIGVADGALRAIYGGAKPTLDTLIALARGNNVNLEWLATGEGPMHPVKSPHQGQSSEIVPANTNLPPEIAGDVVFIPKLDITAFAGNGALALSDDAEILDFLAFQTSWLRARNITPEFARVLTARGDSMEPTIRDGDVLVIDTSIDRIKDNSLYVIVFEGLVFVKRVHQRLTGAIVLMSDNKLYPDEEIPPHAVPGLHVAGRVVWFGRSI